MCPRRFEDERALGDPGEEPGVAQCVQGALHEVRRTALCLCLGPGDSTLFHFRKEKVGKSREISVHHDLERGILFPAGLPDQLGRLTTEMV